MQCGDVAFITLQAGETIGMDLFARRTNPGGTKRSGENEKSQKENEKTEAFLPALPLNSCFILGI